MGEDELAWEGEDECGGVAVEEGADGEFDFDEGGDLGEEFMDGLEGASPVADFDGAGFVGVGVEGDGEEARMDSGTLDWGIGEGEVVEDGAGDGAFEECGGDVGLVPEGDVVVGEARLGEGGEESLSEVGVGTDGVFAPLGPVMGVGVGGGAEGSEVVEDFLDGCECFFPALVGDDFDGGRGEFGFGGAEGGGEPAVVGVLFEEIEWGVFFNAGGDAVCVVYEVDDPGWIVKPADGFFVEFLDRDGGENFERGGVG